ncbi:hypothetical protein OLK87_004463 [Salmonella enterica]|uniref:Uncharacterized protein n=1 Tax=Salmonella phage BP12C TaxID=1543203 RepID=A0A140XFW8_9CAUD|nr:hypothetical protein BJD51_gp13 [Salmonella phage BP12C]ARB12068.1 hypothetical protein STCF118_0067 [Salmonella phage ST-118]EAM4232802.1 hypothetical protein [Salmonella enterica]EBZ0828398.1 hypothetical protein [Salmonella enterica subsp. enterica serovar Infantis]ECA9746826.1 hypothetical protein [Salmonella enterica subsp. enterica serovar Haduna]ECF2550244.1 hypothetical protein [Salmonella enterica subsp. enterica serovar Stanley]ECH9559478.1 hypothetical protein [Salmonella enteri
MKTNLFLIAFAIAMISGGIWGGEDFAAIVIVGGLGFAALGIAVMVGGAAVCVLRDIVIGVRHLFKR